MDSCTATDPDRYALAIVQQYLHEHGYSRALEALEHEAGLRVKDSPRLGGSLLQVLVYDDMERQAAAGGEEDAASRRRQLEEELLSGGGAASPGRCPSRLQRSIEGLHDSNIICIACWPCRRQAVTGSSNGVITVLGYDGTLVRRIAAAATGLLCLALQADASGSGSGSGGGSGSGSGGGGGPRSPSSTSLVAAGCMDGSVVVADAAAGAVLASAQPHRKYVVAAAFSPDGAHLVTASWDHSAAAAAAAAGPEVAGGGSGGGGQRREWELVTVHSVQTAAKVNAVQFLPSSASDASTATSTFLVAVQGSNYLRQLAIAPPPTPTTGAAAVRQEPRINMNPRGDDHVSFSAVHLALSPCARLLLVSADNGRLLVYEREGWTQLRFMVGLPIEQFHHFCAAFDASGTHVMAAAAHGGLAIFHVGSAKRVALLPAHARNVRGLAVDGAANLLLTCSFDRTVKVWEAEEAG